MKARHKCRQVEYLSVHSGGGEVTECQVEEIRVGVGNFVGGRFRNRACGTMGRLR